MTRERRRQNLPSASSARLERTAAWIAVGTGVGLMVIKVIAWRMTGSNAVLSDALESVVNVVASIVALWAIRQAHRPADRSHPYGHGRFELLSAALEGGMITIAAVVIIWRAVEALLSGEIQLQSLDMGLVLLALTIVVNGVVGGWLHRLGKRSGSPALAADGKHLLTDAVTTTAAVGALAIVRITGWTWVDPLFAIAIGLGIGIVGARVVRRALGDLVDEQDPRDFVRIQTLLESHCGENARAPRICSWHKLRVRHVGREHWVDFHVRVPGSIDVRRGHDLASILEDEIEEQLGPGNATAHVEPCDDANCRSCSALNASNAIGPGSGASAEGERP